MEINRSKIIGLFLVIFMLISCENREKIVDKNELLGYDYRLFQQTPAWELAKAVEDEDVEKINEILTKNPKLVDYQEPIFGKTLLMMTISNIQYKPFKALLKKGANVNIHSKYRGSSALMYVCEYRRDFKFAKDLIKYGAKVNDVETDLEEPDKVDTPLMLASESGSLDVVKLLVENGANINFKNDYGQSALSEAVKLQNYEVVLFLLNKGVDYKLPITFIEEQNKTYYLVDELRFYTPELDSHEYNTKMLIVEFLRNKGIEYKDVPVPEYVIKEAKEKYPNSWKEYLERY